MNTLYKDVCPILTNKKHNNNEEIFITTDHNDLRKSSYIAYVIDPSNIKKALQIFSDGHKKYKRTLMLSKSEVSAYIEIAHSCSTNIFVRDENDTIAYTALKSELSREHYKARYDGDKASNLEKLIKLTAHKVPYPLIMDEAINIILDVYSNLEAKEVERRLQAEVAIIQNRVQAIKSISHPSTVLQSLQGLIESLSNKPGIHIIKAPTGSGKTAEVLQPLIEAGIQKNLRPTFLTHRRSIVSSAMHIDHMTHYQEIEPGSEEDIRALKIVVNSSTKQNLSQYFLDSKLLMIDEAKQTLDHIITGPVDNRQKAYDHLLKLIADTETVVLTDADANDVLMAFINQSGRHDITVYEMPTDHSDIAIHLTDTHSVLPLIVDAVEANQRTLIAVDTVPQANALEEQLHKQFPNKAILNITSETINLTDQACFFRNPNESAVKHDVVIYSPVMTSSVSITTQVFDTHFGVFTGVLIPSDCMQMLRRDRTAQAFTVGLDNKQKTKFDLETSSAYIDQYKLFKEVITPFDDIAARVDADKQFFKNHFLAAFNYNLQFENFQVHVIHSNAAHIKLGRAIATSAKQLEQAKYVSNMLTATAISGHVLRALRTNGKPLPKDTPIRLERTRIEAILGKQNLTEADIELWDNGKLEDKLKNIEIALASPADICESEAADRDKVKRDRQLIALRYHYYQLILSTLSIDLLSGEGSYSLDDAKQLLTILHSERLQWNRLGHKRIKKQWLEGDRATRIVNDLLKEIFGLKRKPYIVKRSGIQSRRYRLDEEHHRQLLNAISYRTHPPGS